MQIQSKKDQTNRNQTQKIRIERQINGRDALHASHYLIDNRPSTTTQAKLIRHIEQSAPSSMPIQRMKIVLNGQEPVDINDFAALNQWIHDQSAALLHAAEEVATEGAASPTKETPKSKRPLIVPYFSEKTPEDMKQLIHNPEFLITIDYPSQTKAGTVESTKKPTTNVKPSISRIANTLKSLIQEQLINESKKRRTLQVGGHAIVLSSLVSILCKRMNQDLLFRSILFYAKIGHDTKKLFKTGGTPELPDLIGLRIDQCPEMTNNDVESLLDEQFTTISTIQFMSLQALCDILMQRKLQLVQISSAGGKGRPPSSSPYTFEESDLNKLGLSSSAPGYMGQTAHHNVAYETIPDGNDKWDPENLTLGPDRNFRVYEPGNIYDSEAFSVRSASKATLKSARAETIMTPDIKVEDASNHFRTFLLQNLYQECCISLKEGEPSDKLHITALYVLRRLDTEFLPLEATLRPLLSDINGGENMKNIRDVIKYLNQREKEESEKIAKAHPISSSPEHSETAIFLANHGLQLQPSGADGNCFFTALGVDRQTLAERLTPVEWGQMIHNNDILAIYTREEIIEFLQTDDEWDSDIGDLVPYIAAFLLRLNIRVFDQLYGIESIFNPLGSNNTRILVYNGVDHYNGTIPLDQD